MIIVILLLSQVKKSLGFHARSVIFSGSISALTNHIFVTVTVASKVVPSFGAISSIAVHVLVQAVPTNPISLQVKVPVLIASEKVIKNFPVKDALGFVWLLAKLISTSGCVASKTQEIGR